jgi:hypothetical protein
MIAIINHEPGNPDNVLSTGPVLYAEIDGNAVNPVLYAKIDGNLVDPLRVWHTRGRVITEGDYRFMCARSAWCRAHAPEEPYADPTRKVDLSKVPLPFLNRGQS